jgi:hypothetical protein
VNGLPPGKITRFAGYWTTVVVVEDSGGRDVWWQRWLKRDEWWTWRWRWIPRRRRWWRRPLGTRWAARRGATRTLLHLVEDIGDSLANLMHSWPGTYRRATGWYPVNLTLSVIYKI